MPISPVGATPFIPPTLPSGGGAAAAPTGAPSFAEGLKQVEQLQTSADKAASGVATGEIGDIHQFTAAAAKASLGVELTVAMRNRAVEAYQEIMRMQL